MEEPSLKTFALLIFAWVAWVLLVVLFLPRLLGRLLSFLANRAARTNFHVFIPVLHIYPLAGRIVAHSVIYTLPDATISVEELVLQIRWWRKAPETLFRELRTLDNAHALDPVAHAQQEAEREKNAHWVKRPFYKLRRAWHRSAATRDATSANEPHPLISLICVGLRARIVNNSAYFKHVQAVLDKAEEEHRRKPGTTPPGSAEFDVPPDILSTDDPDNDHHDPDASSYTRYSTSSSDPSVEAINAKPFRQRVLELVSLRIATGAFCFCDMGQSPLVRVVIDAAKVRYRYGAPACPLDISRKRFRVRLSGLKISVADRQAVEAIVHPQPMPRAAVLSEDAPDNTDRMLRRVMDGGYFALNSYMRSPSRKEPKKRPRKRHIALVSQAALQPSEDSHESRQPFRIRSRSERREARKQKDLTCCDILSSETTVADYVFDEPGHVLHPPSSHGLHHHTTTNAFEATTEDFGPGPAPICKLSVVLRGASFSYTVKAIADVERLVERLQPPLHHLTPLSIKLRSADGKRRATGIQVEIDATPRDTGTLDTKPPSNGDAEPPPIVKIPFNPQPETWKGLTKMNVRKWDIDHLEGTGDVIDEKASLPRSGLLLNASQISFKTEIPFNLGAQQKTSITGKHCHAKTVGVVEIPFFKSKLVTVSRNMQYPQVWNDIQTCLTELELKDLEYTFLPDTNRFVEDMTTTFAEQRKKAIDIRYFIPFQEKVRIRAENKYTIIMACSHDNAWGDVLAGVGDRLGKIKMSGENAEVLLSPFVPTEYIPTASVLFWKLSIPECKGEIEMPLLDEPKKLDGAEDVQTGQRPSDSYRSPQYRGRAPSLAQRMRSQLSTVHHREHSISRKISPDCIAVQILRTGKLCVLTGKLLVNEDSSILQPDTPAYVDSVNTTDISIRTSSLTLDLNPHHIAHLQNLVRNYAGAGKHTLSLGERANLHLERKVLSRSIVDEERYPSSDECLILGLSQVTSKNHIIKAMDDLCSVKFNAESIVVRLHMLPHAHCQFTTANCNVLSIASREFSGFFLSNRLGSHLGLAPGHSHPIVLRLDHEDDDMDASRESPHTLHGHASPGVAVERFKVKRQTKTRPESGTFFSVLKIQTGFVRGCILDEDLFRLSRIAIAMSPESLHDDQIAMAAVLGVDNIEVLVERVDLLILSVASTSSSGNSGQTSHSQLVQKSHGSTGESKDRSVPTLLAGVTELQAPSGFRFSTSTLASEEFASRSRMFIPLLSINVLTSWGGRLTAWVDEATLRAQIAHAILARKGNHQSSFHDIGLMRRAAEVEETALEIVSNAKPSIWGNHIFRLQEKRISRLMKRGGYEIPLWFDELPSLPEGFSRSLSNRQELDLAWWIFLRNARKASSLEGNTEELTKYTLHDNISTTISSELAVVLSPECLELAGDVIRRCKEKALEQDFGALSRQSPTSREISPGNLSCSDITNLWDTYERSRTRSWLNPRQATTSSVRRGFEIQSLKIFFMSPILPGEIQTGEHIFRPGSVYDGVHMYFPRGIHYKDMCSNVVTPLRSAGTECEVLSPHFRATHVETFHLSIPSFMIGCAEEYVCKVSRTTLSFRVNANIRRKAGETSERVPGFICDEKRTAVGRVASFAMGKEVSKLSSYASVGRITAIFVLMSRALALQYNSYHAVRTRRQDALCEAIFRSSSRELQEKKPARIQGMLARMSQIARDEGNGQKDRALVFSTTRPGFTAEDISPISESVTREAVSCLYVNLRNVSLRVASEDILEVDMVTGKGCSTDLGKKIKVLEGCTLTVSLGTVSVSILDDLAADTLRMVSELASYVRRATYSIPMLRYGDPDEYAQVSSLVLGPDHEFNYVSDLPPRPASIALGSSNRHRNHTWRYPGLIMDTRLHRHFRSRRYSTPRTDIGSSSISSPQWSTGNNNQLFHHSALGFPDLLHSNSLQSIRSLTAKKTSLEGTGAMNNSEGPDTSNNVLQRDSTANRNDSSARRRSRPMSFADIDQRGCLPKHLLQEVNPIEEDNQLFAYMAVPTAGETGPPRKRAKARVRISPRIPPSFYNFERHSLEESNLTKEKKSQRQETTIDVRLPGRYLQDQSSAEPKEKRNKPHVKNVPMMSAPAATGNSFASPSRPISFRTVPPMTVTLSCQEIVARYFRRESQNADNARDEMKAEIDTSISELRLTWMSSPSKGSYSLVLTTSSTYLSSTSDPNCILNCSVSKIGVTVSVFHSLASSALPKLIASARVSKFRGTLYARDLRSVMKFREEFKADLAAVASAFVTTRSSIVEMTRAIRLSSFRSPYQGRHFVSTMAFDLLLEHSRLSLEGFHPKDSSMCISYCLDGLFFSFVASEDDNAALTLGLRLYGHRLSLFSPSWPSDEIFHFPSLDARGVQWGEALQLPTFLKVSAEPLVNFTSIQGLRHVIFTVSGLTAFQNTANGHMEMSEQYLGKAISATAPNVSDSTTEAHGQAQSSGPTPFSRSFTAWERTKGVRMDVSLRPMSIGLASRQVVALFELEAISGTFEWNKLVVSGVQLHAIISLPKITFMFMRMPTIDFTSADVNLDEHRASLSVAVERSRIDVLKSQEGLTHTFIFRVEVLSISGQVRPWRLLMDAAVWADEQEFVSELQSINYTASSSSAHRIVKSPRTPEYRIPHEHRIFLLGFNIQRFKLAIPLSNNEKLESARLALRATELHLHGRRRFDNFMTPLKNIVELKTHFIGLLWENSALLSTHHSKITIALQRPSPGSGAHFGAVHVVMVAGTWRVCPRKDVVMAILGAKNRKMYRDRADNLRDRAPPFSHIPREGSISSAFSSNNSESESGLLVESLRLTILRTSGFIEGLETDYASLENVKNSQVGSPSKSRDTDMSKLSVPAFSIAMVREQSHDFDIIDIDFSGREGEFPPGCLQKVSNLFSELFGAVASDERKYQTAQVQNSRDVSRDISVLIRFGKSLYRAQEEANTAVESKFCFFAGRSSTILVSLSAKQVFGNENSHTTVMSGISPRLALEVSPLIEGAQVQSLRFVDVRFLHGISPLHPPHTMLHVMKVTALLDAKTLLLTQGRIRSKKSSRNFVSPESSPEPSAEFGERRLLVVLGQPRRSLGPHTHRRADVAALQQEPDIRLQVKLPINGESPNNQVDLFAEQLHFGIHRSRSSQEQKNLPISINVALHEMNVRGKWDILSCRIRVRENLFSCDTSGSVPRSGGKLCVTNIINRLQFEGLQYGNFTMKLAVDALATIWCIPQDELIVESTDISTEISHTMIKAGTRLSGQLKKLRSEVCLLTGREQSETKRNHIPRMQSYDGPATGSASGINVPNGDVVKTPAQNLFETAASGSEDPIPPVSAENLQALSRKTTMRVKGDILRATLRGYQFEETQHSALFELERYELGYERELTSNIDHTHVKRLGVDFSNMALVYNDDVRGIHSDLFKIPTPQLTMKILESSERLNVELTGELELRLGHGFYYWQDFKELSELTVHGIRPTLEVETVPTSPADQTTLWGGKIPQVTVKLNPRIDVIGDLTSDMLAFMEHRRIGVEMIPQHLYNYLVVPIDQFSDTLTKMMLS